MKTTRRKNSQQTLYGRNWLRTRHGGGWLRTPHAREWLQTLGRRECCRSRAVRNGYRPRAGKNGVDPGRERLTPDAPWQSMMVYCGFCLAEHGRILKHVGSNRRVYHYPRIDVTSTLPNSPAVQELAGFLDVFGLPVLKTSESAPLYNIFSSGHGDRTCYGIFYDFRKRSTETKPNNFWRSQVRLSKLDRASLASSEPMG